MPLIVLLEDDPDWQEQAKAAVASAFQENLQLDIVETEKVFVEKLDGGDFYREPPDLFVIDVMLPWDIPRPDMNRPPEDVVANGFYRAGVRCQQRLAKAGLSEIPLILWTILAKKDLDKEYPQWPANVSYVQKKELDPRSLLAELKRLLQSR